jgi:DNA-binding CsgD family transcriptional regulator
MMNLVALLHEWSSASPDWPALWKALQDLIPFTSAAAFSLTDSRVESWSGKQAWPSADDVKAALSSHPMRRWRAVRPVVRRVSETMPRHLFRRTETWALLHGRLGVDFELSLLLPNSARDGLMFSLYRPATDFTGREHALLELLLPHFERAFGRRNVAPVELQTHHVANEEQFFAWLTSITTWPMSHREGDVLFWLCQGKTNDEIGTILGIAGRTAETHALRLYPKMGVENRFGAIAAVNRLAARHGVAIVPEPCATTPLAGCAPAVRLAA